jgi:hypothetical protein
LAGVVISGRDTGIPVIPFMREEARGKYPDLRDENNRER